MRTPLRSRDWDGWMLRHWITTGVLLGVILSGIVFALVYLPTFVKWVAA